MSGEVGTLLQGVATLPVGDVTDEQRRKASITAAAHATDRTDLSSILSALGLLPPRAPRPRAPINLRRARNEGQHRSLWPLTDQCRDDFLRVVESVPVGAFFSINHIRDRLDAAQIPDRARGGLMAGAMSAGLCEEARELVDGFGPVVWHVPSTGARTNASGVKVYRRTNPKKE